jgi:hypothetical protein
VAVAVRIINWNIQNYGPTKSALADVVTAIAQVVVAQRADIFVLLEVNTVYGVEAARISEIMRAALVAEEDRQFGQDAWETCVRSTNTGLEFYSFFVRDNEATIPLVTDFDSRSLGGRGPQPVDITQAVFTEHRLAGVQTFFPLLAPDIGMVSLGGRLQPRPPIWDGRLPALGLFWLPDATAGYRLLPLVACHFAADATKAIGQFMMLPAFKLLRGLGPPPPHPSVPNPVRLRVELDADPRPVARAPNFYVLTGDFNVDYQTTPGGYAAISGPAGGDRSLGATPWDRNANTHYMTYGNWNRTIRLTDQLGVNLYDNFFTREPPGVPSPTAGTTFGQVYNHAGAVRIGGLALSQSVTHYMELDQRGFSSRQYQGFVTDYAAQLRIRQPPYMNVKAALVGGRLISDHMATTLDLSVR